MLENVQLVSGKMEFSNMKKSVPEKKYAVIKVNVWIQMLNDGKKPTKWLKPSSKGTGVHFDFIKKQEDYDNGIKELQLYIEKVNEQFDLDFSLKHKD